MQLKKGCKRIVVKIGSSILTRDRGNIDEKKFFDIASQVKELRKRNIEVVLVSSGAIACGMSFLKQKTRPKELFVLQAIASLGQPYLVELYNKSFAKFNLRCGQVLLTWDDFDDRVRYLNAKNTLLELLKLGFIPVINENDTVSTQEIKFGDNDKLSSLVAILVEADSLVILSDVDGLYDKDRVVLPIVEHITSRIEALATGANKQTSVGGMLSKIRAAKMSVNSGIPCLIANGNTKDVLVKIADNEPLGTLFSCCSGKIASHKGWIAFSAKSKGKLIIDDGAVAALKAHKSLLCVGIIDCQGDFKRSDIVSIADSADNIIAKGKVNFDKPYIDKNKRKKTPQEIIHCDNLALI
jgi:glutamate 5-kinase